VDVIRWSGYATHEAEMNDKHNDTAHQPYVDVDRLKSSDGLVAVISQRRANGEFTFTIFKEFLRDDEVQKTSFIPESMWDSFGRMVTLAQDTIRELKRSGKAPFRIVRT